jgi:hypothetical protein
MLSVYDANNLLVGDVIGFDNTYGAYVLLESNGQLFSLMVNSNNVWNWAGQTYGSQDCTGGPIIDADQAISNLQTSAGVVRVPGGFDVYISDLSSAPFSSLASSQLAWWGTCYPINPARPIRALPTLPPIHLPFIPPFHLHRHQ